MVRISLGGNGLGVVLPFISWATLPPLLTNIFLSALYSTQLVSRPTAQPQAFKHQARARAVVISAYLVYQLVTSLQTLHRSANFYSLLDLGHDADVDDVRRSFRRLARTYHPDKVGSSGEAIFVAIRLASECLTDPVKRWAYDRFGASVMEWQNAITLRDYALRGLQLSASFYVLNPIVFGLVVWLNGESIFSFWRFVLLFSLAALEFPLLAYSQPPPFLSWFRRTGLVPIHATPHEVASLLREAYTSALLASRQLLPLLPAALGLAPELVEPKTLDEMERELKAMADVTEQMARQAHAASVETRGVLCNDLAPFRPPQRATVPTLRDAAAQAAKARAAPSSPSSSSIRAPSRAEEAWIQSLARQILRRRLGAVEAIVDTARRLRSEEGGVGRSTSTDDTSPGHVGRRGQQREGGDSVEADGRDEATTLKPGTTTRLGGADVRAGEKSSSSPTSARGARESVQVVLPPQSAS